MMGRTHAASGALAWAAVCATAPLFGIRPGWPAVLAGLVSTAGAALLPDLDHPEATIAHTFGPVTRAAAEFVHRISGGHRHATHSLAFAALAAALVWPAVLLGRGWIAWPALFVLCAFAARAVHIKPSMVPLAAVTFTGTCWFTLRADVGWLPLSVVVGILAHLAGDCLTREGCPLLWPKPRHYMLAVIRRTGNKVETWLFAPVFTAGTIALVVLFR